jgi:Flp pilus assembly CpaF family ATPase
MLEGELPLDGSRFAGQLPPVVPAPTFAIRKKAVAIFTLGQYVDGWHHDGRAARRLIEAVRAHRNILVIGGTGSGKTTLVNAIINQMVESRTRPNGFSSSRTPARSSARPRTTSSTTPAST